MRFVSGDSPNMPGARRRQRPDCDGGGNGQQANAGEPVAVDGVERGPIVERHDRGRGSVGSSRQRLEHTAAGIDEAADTGVAGSGLGHAVLDASENDLLKMLVPLHGREPAVVADVDDEIGPLFRGAV